MKTTTLHFNDTNLLRPLMHDYINQNEATKPLYQFAPEPAAIAQAIAQRKKHEPNRSVLVNALKRQYKEAGISDKTVEANIDKLAQSNCFTITTGHQLNLFGSSQYYIYKIIEVIKYTQEIKAQHPEYEFVPMFWLASGDHDFEEIKFAKINGKRYAWESQEKGPVGRYNPQAVLKVIEELKDFWESEPVTGSYLRNLFTEAYSKPTLSQATRNWTHELFKTYGLVVIEGDDNELKKEFRHIIKKELFEETTFTQVEKTNNYLSEHNYHIQVYARPINLFMITEHGRERIVKLNDRFATVESESSFSYTEIEELIEQTPDVFSPNALMRPMYQESILPNLCYVGGAGEIAYWLQIKSAFEAHGVFYPQVISRNSGIWLSRRLGKKLEKMGLQYPDFFTRKEDLIAQYAESHFAAKRFFQLSETIEILWEEFQNESDTAFHDLKILTGQTAAEKIKELKKLRHDMRKVVKAKNDADFVILHEVFDRIFPDGSFQERVETFLPNYLLLGNTYIETLFEHIQPAEHKVLVFEF
ncbi:bacillithiol biosynthesis cysteine-adding enzyme BshC [bacterium]|nr:bacillithiol biosynthesis cysteine-adding enzyme BshC [bacterium]